MRGHPELCRRCDLVDSGLSRPRLILDKKCLKGFAGNERMDGWAGLKGEK